MERRLARPGFEARLSLLRRRHGLAACLMVREPVTGALASASLAPHRRKHSEPHTVLTALQMAYGCALRAGRVGQGAICSAGFMPQPGVNQVRFGSPWRLRCLASPLSREGPIKRGSVDPAPQSQPDSFRLARRGRGVPPCHGGERLEKKGEVTENAPAAAAGAPATAASSTADETNN
jgi:hypothetical protein